MSNEYPDPSIKTVKELIEWLKLFREDLRLEITYDSGFGQGAGLSREGIYETTEGKLRIDIIS